MIPGSEKGWIKKGQRLSPSTEFKKGILENPPKNWKGNFAGKSAIHRWVDLWKGKPKVCSQCGTETAKKYEWTNIDHKYRRVLDDYIRLCTSCHRKYDIEFNSYRKK